MNIILPSKTIFYTIERAIKEYRKFAQKNISSEIGNITIDQGLILLFLNDRPELTQKKIGNLIFRGNASVTRMINSLVKKNFLERSVNEQDRRRYELEITPEGEEILNSLSSIITTNRQKAIEGITQKEENQLTMILNKIISNCKAEDE